MNNTHNQSAHTPKGRKPKGGAGTKRVRLNTSLDSRASTEMHRRASLAGQTVPDFLSEVFLPVPITDNARIDWLEKNYLNSMDSPRFLFSKPKQGWHPSLAAKFPNGFWYKHWQSKGEQNQFHTLREAIDSVMTQ